MDKPTQKTKLAEIILGGQDGLVNILGLALGLVAANSPLRIIIAGGLAATFAESISMGAVVFTSRSAERDQYEGEKAKLDQMIKHQPAKAKQNLHTIYEDQGFDGELLNQVADKVTADHDLWLATLMHEGTDLVPIKTTDIVWQSIITLFATLVGSLIPLTPFFFTNSEHLALAFALVAAALVLFGVGAYSTYVHIKKPLKGGVQMTIIGLGAAFVGYLIGLLFKA